MPSNDNTTSILTRIGISLADTQTNDAQYQKYLQDDDYNPLIVHKNITKCATKLLTMDFSFDIFSGDKRKPYFNDKKLNFKDDILNKVIYSSNYLYNGLCFVGRIHYVAFVDRVLCKFLIPEIDPNKKVLYVP
jgi:hypothetical protein